MDSNKIKTIFFLSFLVGLVLALSAYHFADQNKLVRYVLSGGIAGESQDIQIFKSGHVKIENRGQSSRVRMTEKELTSLTSLLDKIPSSHRTWTKPEEPGCCDQIYMYIQYKGKYLHFFKDEKLALPEEDLEKIRVKFSDLMRKEQF